MTWTNWTIEIQQADEKVGFLLVITLQNDDTRQERTERRFWAEFSAHISGIWAEKLKHDTPSAFFRSHVYEFHLWVVLSCRV